MHELTLPAIKKYTVSFTKHESISDNTGHFGPDDNIRTVKTRLQGAKRLVDNS